MIVEHIGGTSFSLSNFREIDFLLSTNRDLDFYRVHFQGDILDAISRYFGRKLPIVDDTLLSSNVGCIS